MVDKNKIIYFNSKFTAKALPKTDDEDESVVIEGYASTNDKDRHGDVVPSSVWEKGIQDYLKNPIILAYHNHTMPVGKMVEHKVDDKGLWIKANISDAAGDVYKLVKKGILSAFSIGFRIKDAEYNTAAEVFIVKELELHEISVVSVPANQNTLFNLSKAFESAEEFKSFKMQFASSSDSAKGLEASGTANSDINEEWNMDPKQLEQMLADAAAKAAEQTAKALIEAQQKAAKEKADAEKAEAELQARIKAAVAAVTPTETGADKLLAEVEKRLQDTQAESKKALEGLEAALKEKAAELEAIQKSRMQFQDGKGASMEYGDKEKAVLLAKMAGKALGDTKFGREMVEKFGAHVPSATWETEVSLTMENEVRQRLVVAPTLRAIQMQTNVMTIPVNPEAGVATWVQNAQFGTANSAGSNATHALKEITLNAYKVATNEYVAFEEEEDALLAIMPVVRDAMVRRVARAVDRAMLRGAGAGADPVKGLGVYDASSSVTLDISDGAKLTVAKLQAMRRDLGIWGLDPAEVIYIVSTEGYYDLLDDATFQTMDKVGAQATLLRGQIGSVANTPVLVSGEFEDKANGTIGAIAFNPMNFLVGNQRGLRVDTDDLVETQRRVMVASLRTGMTQVSTVNGAGVSALRYVA
jgi:HK97 family phage prohead protease/HK97 family phage major capsid protein